MRITIVNLYFIDKIITSEEFKYILSHFTRSIKRKVSKKNRIKMKNCREKRRP